MQNDIRWKQRFYNYQKALSQLTKFIEKGELNEISDYVGEFHHDANSSGDSGVIIEVELRSYAKCALTIIYKGSPLA
jgi:hypothetical protein